MLELDNCWCQTGTIADNSWHQTGTTTKISSWQLPAREYNKMPSLIPGLTEGRVVHYVLSSGRNIGAHRPAFVVRDWKQDNGLCNLQVFTDSINDFINVSAQVEGVSPGANGLLWATSVHYSEEKEPGSWHWPEKE